LWRVLSPVGGPDRESCFHLTFTINRIESMSLTQRRKYK
jgi:hypothetical protein